MIFKTKRMKKLLYILPMVTVLMLPLTINAQWGRSDGLFSDYNDPYYNDRGGEALHIIFGGSSPGDDVNIGAPDIEDPTPLGSGLIIMLMAGAGYALLKKKEEAK